MPEDEGMSAGKRSATTKGQKVLAEAGKEAVSTKTIRKAMKRLAAVSAEVDSIRQLLETVESKEQRARGPARHR